MVSSKVRQSPFTTELQREAGQKAADGKQIASELRSDTPNTRSPSAGLWLLAPQRQPTVHDFGPDLRGVSQLWKTACLCSCEIRTQRGLGESDDSEFYKWERRLQVFAKRKLVSGDAHFD